MTMYPTERYKVLKHLDGTCVLVDRNKGVIATTKGAYGQDLDAQCRELNKAAEGVMEYAKSCLDFIEL